LEMPRPSDDYIARANRRAGLHTEGVKGILILNGGGILALLTFVTQLTLATAPKPGLIQTITVAIACFSGGLVAAAPINHLRYEASRLYDNEETNKTAGKAIRNSSSDAVLLIASPLLHGGSDCCGWHSLIGNVVATQRRNQGIGTPEGSGTLQFVRPGSRGPQHHTCEITAHRFSARGSPSDAYADSRLRLGE
jgi:hypothetical protein